ncbi:MAG: universal stress protein [Bacteroidota bacterium]
MPTQLQIKKILIPLDFSLTSFKAVDQAVALAKLTKAEIILLHVTEYLNATTDPLFISSLPTETYESEIAKTVNDSLSKVVEKIKKEGIENVSILAVNGRTHKEIIRASKKAKADIIIMGTHGVSGIREFVMGSNTFRVVSDAECPVLSVQRKNKTDGFNNILVPFSDSPHSREKVMYAIKIAQIYGAKLNVLGIDADNTKTHLKKIEAEALQIKGIVEGHGLKSSIKVISGAYNAKTILDYSTKVNADLIVVMGDALRQDLTEYFTGSASQQIINHSPVPVLSVHSKINPAMMELWQAI